MVAIRPVLCLLLVVVAWSGDAVPVIAGSTVVHDLAARIGGERFAVSCLVRPGISPHGYQPVPDDVRRLAAARLVVINGLGFEGWFENLAAEARFAGTVVVATAGIQTIGSAGCDAHDHEGHDHGAPDPHPYNSIRQGVRYAENIRDALLAADPEGAEGIRARAATVIDELRRTDAWATAELAAIPRGQRKLIVNHDALAYFARDYGFEVLALGTALENSQPSASRIAELAAFIRQQGVKGVFLEQGKNPKLIEQLAAEAGVKVGASLHLDGVGAPGTPAGTYVGMFRANVEAILAALR
jgi:zinc/manganese transport system substrate-binding protein